MQTVQSKDWIAQRYDFLSLPKFSNRFFVSSRKSDRFVLKNWEKFYGLEEKSAQRLPNKGNDTSHDKGFFNCGEEGCRIEFDNINVSFIRNVYIYNQECEWANVIISTEPIPNSYKRKNRCKSVINIDKFDTWDSGAHAIWINDNEITLKTVSETTGKRPWSQYIDG